MLLSYYINDIFKGKIMINDNISAEFISRELNNSYPINVLEEIDSTNKYLKRAVNDETIEGATVIALSQTEGRGRFERKFYSSEDSGIYMSVFLRPNVSIDEMPLITAAAAVSVCEALEAYGCKNAMIKWVNDILIDSKKVCGILSEGVINSETGKFEGVIVGIGINVYKPYNDFADDIKDIAGAAFETRENDLKNKIAAYIIKRLISYSKNLSSKEFLEYYKQRSIVIGKTVTVITGENKETATAIAIDDKCRLLVEFQDKSRRYLDSGEISIKL